ncbi:MAG: hypothetical protein ACLP0A_09745 [Verrucomicrobiia bacterium]
MTHLMCDTSLYKCDTSAIVSQLESSDAVVERVRRRGFGGLRGVAWGGGSALAERGYSGTAADRADGTAAPT